MVVINLYVNDFVCREGFLFQLSVKYHKGHCKAGPFNSPMVSGSTAKRKG